MVTKNIQLILNKTTPHLGQVGNIISVKPGYARNYLLPNKIAEQITKGKMQYIKKLAEKQLQIIDNNMHKMRQMKKHIESISKFSLKRKISEHNNIFGSVTEKDIIQMLREMTGITLEKSQIEIPEIKTTGVYDIRIILLENLIVEIRLHILPEIISS